MQKKLALVCLFPLLCLPNSCFLFEKRKNESKSSESVQAPVTPAPFLNELKTSEDYLTLHTTDELGFSLVKYSFFFSEPDQKINFQNMSLFNFHLQFFKLHIPAFSDISNETYETLLRPGPERKILGGAIYWAPERALEEFNKVPGTLGVTLYFSTNFDDIETIVKKIKDTAPFAEGRVTFLFESTVDFVKHKRPLMAQKKIASSFLNTFINQGPQKKEILDVNP